MNTTGYCVICGKPCSRMYCSWACKVKAKTGGPVIGHGECVWCKQPLPGGRRKFCSGGCEREFVRKQREESRAGHEGCSAKTENPEAIWEGECEYCGARLTGNKRRFCSGKCSMRARSARIKAQRDTTQPAPDAPTIAPPASSFQKVIAPPSIVTAYTDKRVYIRAGYGSSAMWRTYCKRCRSWAFVVDSRMSCCGGPPPIPTKIEVRQMSESEARRRPPSKKVQRAILEEQHNRCLYCGQEFGSAHVRQHNGDEEIIILSIHWDHAEPYCYGHNNNPRNFVAACHVCNGIKAGKVFDSLESVREYLRQRREAKGYDF